MNKLTTPYEFIKQSTTFESVLRMTTKREEPIARAMLTKLISDAMYLSKSEGFNEGGEYVLRYLEDEVYGDSIQESDIYSEFIND